MGDAKVDEARMTGRLSLLHLQLARLERARWLVAVLTATSVLGSTVLLALLSVFLLDWLFGLDVLQRLLLMVLAASGILWVARKLWRASRTLAHGPVQAALWVERQHQIDSDLVAALQFEREAASEANSPRLTAAIVAYVAEATPSIDVFRGFSAGALPGGGALLLLSLTVVTGLVAWAPQHATVFGQRLLLGNQGYPTRTRLERVVVGKTVVLDRAQQGAFTATAKAAEAQPLGFAVVCVGVRPRSLTVHLRAATGRGAVTRVVLKPDEAVGDKAPAYRGELPRLYEDLEYWIVAGDTKSPVGRVEMIALPTVEIDVRATPPKYTAAQTVEGQGKISDGPLLEGSAIAFAVHCTNRKRLQRVVLTLNGGGDKQELELVASDEQQRQWKLPPEGTPLAALRTDWQYEVHVTDIDGLSPALPLRGLLRVMPDAPPTIAASVVHRLVLPTAMPVVHFRLADDYGISRLQLLLDIERGEAGQVGPSPSPLEPTIGQQRRLEIQLPSSVIAGPHLPLTDHYAVDLRSADLMPGDRIKLTLEASDYRGVDNPAATASSEAILLEVADESAVLGAIQQADERGEAQLEEIIRRQLDVGQGP